MRGLSLLLLLLMGSLSICEAGDQIIEIVHTVEPGFTSIEQKERVIYIDYNGGMIHNVDLVTNECRKISLRSSDSITSNNLNPDLQLLEEKVRTFSTIEVLDSTFTDMVTLLFGARAMLVKTIRSPMLKLYGFTFSPGRVDYLIAPDHHLVGPLQEISKFNEQFYKEFPLLCQLDILGLLPFFHGIPKETRRHGVVTKVKYFVVEEGTLKRRLALTCK